MQPRIPEVTLLEEVARGQNGVVFRALFHGSACTVKLPNDGLANRAWPFRSFEQDVLQLARLRRAGLPRVVKLDATEETPYAILDWPEGRPLRRVLAGELSQVEALRLALRLAHSIQQLHDAGFVHGSLSAEHVLISDYGQQVTLLDVGSIARSIPFDASADTRLFGGLLRDLISCCTPGASDLTALRRLSDELITGRHRELSGVIGECERLGEQFVERHSSFPPPLLEHQPPRPRLRPPRHVRSELAQLHRSWAQAAGQAGRIALVLGPVGSGKSRLVSGFADDLAALDAQVLLVKCRDSDWEPFSGLKRMLEAHLAGLALLPAARRDELVASLRAAAGPIASHIRLLSPRLAELFRDAAPVLSDGDAQQIFVDGLVAFLANYLAASGPSALVIDDIHWLDASSRMVFSRLAPKLCQQGHLMVCCGRDDADSRRAVERFCDGLSPAPIDTVALGPLNRRDACDVIAEYLGIEVACADELVDQLSRLSDGTPLSLIELLGLTLENGLLRPSRGSWQLDADPIGQMRLPASSQALLERRLCGLQDPTLEVLQVVALMRAGVEADVLARVTGMPLEHIRSALAQAVGARLIETHQDEVKRLVHDCISEALLRGLPEARQRELHQRIAEVLAETHGSGPEYDCKLACHYARGAMEANPRAVFESTRKAARRAIEACDDALALSFFVPAEQAARLAGIQPERAFFLEFAEASLRSGATERALECFTRALAVSRPGPERAHVRGCMAWVHHLESDADSCTDALEAALRECGRSLPGDRPSSVLRDLLGGLRPLPRRRRDDTETLVGLYIECTRVAGESGRPLQALASIFHLAQLVGDLAPGRALVHAELLCAFGLSMLGAERSARQRFARAERIAKQTADPIAQTLCHAVAHAIAGWRGELEECERQARLCVDERGHFMDLGELCHVCFCMYEIEIARGRPEQALAWSEKALARVQHSARAPAVFALVQDATFCTLQAMGREAEVARLRRRFGQAERPALRPGSYFHLLSFQCRAQELLGRGELGAALVQLTEEWGQLGQSPKRAHLLATLYYIHVAHAQVQQCLRCGGKQRAQHLAKLERAVAELTAAARVPLSKAHARVTHAALCWLRGRSLAAEQLLSEAEWLALHHDCPFVQFAAMRLRAHMLRASGKPEAALNQARAAGRIAHQYKQQHHLRAICEEFGLTEPPDEPPPAEPGILDTRRELDALLHIGRATSRDLGPERQARLILDELLMTLDAERAFLFMRDDASGQLERHAARHRLGDDLERDTHCHHELVEQVYATGQTQLVDSAEGVTDRRRDGRACIVAGLVLREQTVGVLYLDRAEQAGAFTSQDVALLQVLAHQVPIALELAGTLRERERLHQNLRQAQKMEAIGRLAGGIAHDFNNVLTAISLSAANLASAAGLTGRLAEDLGEIRAAARRGSELTCQLLTFSRGKSVPPRRVVLGDVVTRLAPTLNRLVRSDVHLDMQLSDEPLATLADPNQIERILMNLCQNASDAMPQGGSITLRLSRATSADAIAQSAGLDPGRSYALLSVEDNGTGMDEEVRARLFEPFFTTKPGNHGTGLGLANVYAIVQQCRGHIDVISEPGAGSTFRIFLVLCGEAELELRPLQSQAPEGPSLDSSVSFNVLVVDDDEATRRQTARILERHGYRVWVGHDGVDALRAIDGAVEPDVLVTDVDMPRMDGIALAAKLRARNPSIGLLFISGQSAEPLERSGLRGQHAEFLPKPFKQHELLARLSRVLRAAAPLDATPASSNN